MGSTDPKTTLRLMLMSLFFLLVPALFIGGLLPRSWLPQSRPILPAFILMGLFSLCALVYRLLAK